MSDIVALVRKVARAHGYAIGVHGSLARDVDLIAVPWIEPASAPDELAEAIADELGSAVKNRRSRPHGRVGYVVLIPGGKRPNYVDLSVMAPVGVQQAVGATDVEELAIGAADAEVRRHRARAPSDARGPAAGTRRP